MPHLVVSLKEREIGRYPVDIQTRIGRDPNLEVVIENVGVSRHHATLSFDGHQARLQDQNSANGVFVNGRRVTATTLADGDVIQIGKFTLNYSALDLPEDAAVSLKRTGGRSRDMQKTFALGPAEVQRLLASQQAAQPADAPQAVGLSQTMPQVHALVEDEGGLDPAVKLLGGGLALIALLGTVVFLLL